MLVFPPLRPSEGIQSLMNGLKFLQKMGVHPAQEKFGSCQIMPILFRKLQKLGQSLFTTAR